MAPTSPPVKTTSSRWWWVAIIAALLVHGWLVTRNWSSGFLIGHEFRQTQTAISAYFIQHEHNFSLAYPTPVLGKPWSVPFEFPLYEWTVVLVSNQLHLPLVEAARGVTLACFYLTLAGLWGLLGTVGYRPAARQLALLLALASPVYLFYSRAFLIESMVLMFSVWFLQAFVRTLDGRRWWWLALTALFGAGAALAKVTTFMVWTFAATVWGLWRVWQGRRDGTWQRTLAWAAACAAIPCSTALWWVYKSDAIKALNPAGAELQAGQLEHFNFGTLADRWSPERWSHLLGNLHHAALPVWLILPVVGIGCLAARRFDWKVLAPLGLLLAAMLTFPVLYGVHDYYFYAAALTVPTAMGAACSHLLEKPRARVAGIGLVAILFGFQLHTYWRVYRPEQIAVSNGGSSLTAMLRDMTPPESVLVIAGEDWIPVVPYYAQRRALMLQTANANRPAFVAKAFAAMAGEDIAALILTGGERNNRDLLAKAVSTFGIDPQVALVDKDSDIYLSPKYRDNILGRLEDHPVYPGIELKDRAEYRKHPPKPPSATSTIIADQKIHPVLPVQVPAFFTTISPPPYQYRTQFGFGPDAIQDTPILGAHPSSAFWIHIPPRAARLKFSFGMKPETYERTGEKTDGVTFAIIWQHPDGTQQTLWERRLQPATVLSDRGLQQAEIVLPKNATGSIILSNEPGPTLSFDWSGWGPVSFQPASNP